MPSKIDREKKFPERKVIGNVIFLENIKGL